MSGAFCVARGKTFWRGSGKEARTTVINRNATCTYVNQIGLSLYPDGPQEHSTLEPTIHQPTRQTVT